MALGEVKYTYKFKFEFEMDMACSIFKYYINDTIFEIVYGISIA